MKIKILDVFSGIGCMHLGFNRVTNSIFEVAGCIQYEPRFGNNIPKYEEEVQYAFKVYEKNFGHKDTFLNKNIFKINKKYLPDIDLLVAGFPCQPFSNANNKRKGMKDENKGQLWWELINIIKEKRPKFALFENVEGLITSSNGNDFATILHSLHKEGYNVEYRHIRASDYGCGTIRRRIFIFCWKRNSSFDKKIPQNPHQIIKNHGVLANAFSIKKANVKWAYDFDYNDYQIRYDINNKFNNSGVMLNGKFYSIDTTPIQEGSIPLKMFLDTFVPKRFYLKVNQIKSVNERYIYRDLNNPSIAILTREGQLGATNTHYIKQPVKNGYMVRFITPNECERLHGLPNNFTLLENTNLTQRQIDILRYKVIGNSIVVPLITRIGESLQKKLIQFEMI